MICKVWMHAGCIAIRMHFAHIVFKPHPGVNASVQCHQTKQTKQTNKKANRTPYSTSFCDLMYARKKFPTSPPPSSSWLSTSPDRQPCRPGRRNGQHCCSASVVVPLPILLSSSLLPACRPSSTPVPTICPVWGVIKLIKSNLGGAAWDKRNWVDWQYSP